MQGSPVPVIRCNHEFALRETTDSRRNADNLGLCRVILLTLRGLHGMSRDDTKLRRLHDVGRSLVTELDPELVFDRILAVAREITGAQYAALGVLNETRTELERFLTAGIDEDDRRAIGDLPRGRGVLGVLIEDPRPLRLSDVGSHPDSYGFPASHPMMHSFLGVPIAIRGEAWGNLYLAEKTGGAAFTDEDEDAAVVLADYAATAIGNARLYQRSEQRRKELERAVLGLEASRDIADAIGTSLELERILELIAKRGRALITARTVVIMLCDGPDLVVAACAGHATEAAGRRIPIAAATSGELLARGRSERIDDVAARLRISPEEIGVPDARSALLVPMFHSGEPVGVLAAFDRTGEVRSFSAADEQLMRTFAASAATAVAMSRSVTTDRLRSTIEAADVERARLARELHDETLQTLGALRVSLASALRQGDPDNSLRTMEQAIGDIELAIENLRSLIADLRPSLLDDLGLQPAIESLLERCRGDALEITSELSLETGVGVDTAPDRELETTIYRLVQEALTNVVKHANASHVHVVMRADGVQVIVEVTDDGRGFDVSVPATGFGLAGMRERVFLAGGMLELDSSQSGTAIRARLPTPEPPAVANLRQVAAG
jgi:signal transduction histidine kinase